MTIETQLRPSSTRSTELLPVHGDTEHQSPRHNAHARGQALPLDTRQQRKRHCKRPSQQGPCLAAVGPASRNRTNQAHEERGSNPPRGDSKQTRIRRRSCKHNPHGADRTRTKAASHQERPDPTPAWTAQRPQAPQPPNPDMHREVRGRNLPRGRRVATIVGLRRPARRSTFCEPSGPSPRRRVSGRLRATH
jgi:hypothetical protein